MSDNINNRTAIALLWSGIERLGFQAINLVVQIILARLLLPNDFGLVGMLVVFVSVSQAIIDGGFGEALIQRKNATPKDYSTIFYFNLSVSVFCYLLLVLFAPNIAAFYNEPRLVLLTRVVGLNLIINAIGQIQYTLLVKNIEFKTISKVRLISVVFSGILGVALAYWGVGVWALVIFTLASNLFRSILLWVFNKWRPGLIFSMESLNQLFPFGSKLFISTIIADLFENIYLIVIGKFFSAKDLGFYTQAKTFQLVPVVTFSLIVENVIFPTLSRYQDDIDMLKRGFSKAMKLQVFINFPVMLGLMVVAKPLILLLLTDKWLTSVLYLQLLCVCGLFYPIGVTNMNVFKVTGRSDLYLRLTIISRVLTVISIVIGLQWGIVGLIVGRMLNSMITSTIAICFSGKLIKYHLGEQLMDILPILFAAAVMAAVVYLIGQLDHYSLLSQLLVQILSGALVYSGMSYLLRIAPFIEGSSMIRKVLVERQNY